MIYTNALQLLSLASVALAGSATNGDDREVPYGAFPSSTLVTSAIPTPASSSVASPATPSSTTSLGQAIIENHCQTPIYVWSVGSVTPAPVTVSSGGRYSETYRLDHDTGGVALKISTQQDGLYNSAPLTIFAYNLNGQEVWYDLSDVFGDPFKGHPVVLVPAEPAINWADGVPPSGSQVRVQSASNNLVLTLC
ncbi:Antigenic thaumatin-like protein [Penicillium oxalicum]|uniref:Bys1 family protein n=1 Tax=Penicillium oxalicum (strain 114-2 / CGMCC 5302) TaxID=933388 RepID=S8B5E5_PENO1|nr:Antigenic thaumatin-like protein [Penicillium oxalicum]EPS34078.1 hypothetical protein PDE_09040 [Penicillium oxalicum 114-2]KAI2794344.1 Antigenic thaumatin-like protein [Penicillium oxalicum]